MSTSTRTTSSPSLLDMAILAIMFVLVMYGITQYFNNSNVAPVYIDGKIANIAPGSKYEVMEGSTSPYTVIRVNDEETIGSAITDRTGKIVTFRELKGCSDYTEMLAVKKENPVKSFCTDRVNPGGEYKDFKNVYMFGSVKENIRVAMAIGSFPVQADAEGSEEDFKEAIERLRKVNDTDVASMTLDADVKSKENVQEVKEVIVANTTPVSNEEVLIDPKLEKVDTQVSLVSDADQARANLDIAISNVRDEVLFYNATVQIFSDDIELQGKAKRHLDDAVEAARLAGITLQKMGSMV